MWLFGWRWNQFVFFLIIQLKVESVRIFSDLFSWRWNQFVSFLIYSVEGGIRSYFSLLPPLARSSAMTSSPLNFLEIVMNRSSFLPKLLLFSPKRRAMLQKISNLLECHKDTEPLNHAFMYSLVSLLSGIYRQSPTFLPITKSLF